MQLPSRANAKYFKEDRWQGTNLSVVVEVEDDPEYFVAQFTCDDEAQAMQILRSMIENTDENRVIEVIGYRIENFDFGVGDFLPAPSAVQN